MLDPPEVSPKVGEIGIAGARRADPAPLGALPVASAGASGAAPVAAGAGRCKREEKPKEKGRSLDCVARGSLGSVPTPLMPVDEQAFHLIQDDALIAKIHTEELPPDEYYDQLGPVLQKSSRGQIRPW